MGKPCVNTNGSWRCFSGITQCNFIGCKRLRTSHLNPSHQCKYLLLDRRNIQHGANIQTRRARLRETPNTQADIRRDSIALRHSHQTASKLSHRPAPLSYCDRAFLQPLLPNRDHQATQQFLLVVSRLTRDEQKDLQTCSHVFLHPPRPTQQPRREEDHTRDATTCHRQRIDQRLRL